MRQTPPFPNAQKGWFECVTRDQIKGRRSTPRSATEPGGAPTFGYFELRSAILGGFSQLGNFPARRAPLSQHPNIEVVGAKPPTRLRGATERRGTSRNATETDGTPKFGYSALVSAKFWCVFLQNRKYFCARRPLFPNAQIRMVERVTKNQTKGRRGTLRNLAERLNLATPHWGPPNYGGYPPK